MKPSRRAGLLVDQLLARGTIDVEELARELVVSKSAVTGYRLGALTMPLERQLCLVLLVERQFPELRSEAANLRAQVEATVAFRTRELLGDRPVREEHVVGSARRRRAADPRLHG